MAKFYYGGQAVMEGVMMRGRASAAVAVRRPGGSIYLYEEALNPRLYQNKFFRMPFLRGMLLLWEMLVLGKRIMTLSANMAMGASDPEAATQPQAEATNAQHSPTSDAPVQEKAAPVGGVALILPLLVSLTFAIAIFFVGPLLITNLLSHQI